MTTVPGESIAASLPEEIAAIIGETSRQKHLHMPAQPNYRNRLAEAFHMSDAPALMKKEIHKVTVVATELKYDHPNFGMTAHMQYEDAYLVALQMRPCHDHDLYFDGRMVRPTNWFSGFTSMYDLRRDPVADIRDPYHCVMFHLSREALDNLAYESGVSRIGDLHDQPGVGIDDPVVRHLLSSLRPAIAKPEEANALFLDHVALALTAHVAHAYGGMNTARSLPRGGLAPWQERRVKELLSANLQEEMPLSLLAKECNLSVRHFARAFRQSVGVPPHRWLQQRRIDFAREQLSNRSMTLTDVALMCGFADQSHFTRVFTAIVGVSPGAWRRANGVAEEPAGRKTVGFAGGV